jgi:hypothetical protein
MALVHAGDAEHRHGLFMAGLVRIPPDRHERRLERVGAIDVHGRPFLVLAVAVHQQRFQTLLPVRRWGMSSIAITRLLQRARGMPR